jgi:hypothetical protein
MQAVAEAIAGPVIMNSDFKQLLAPTPEFPHPGRLLIGIQ